MYEQSVEEITQSAIQSGVVEGGNEDAVSGAILASRPEHGGISADQLESARVFAVQILVDDSSSMQGFKEPVCRALKRYVSELKDAEAEAEGEVDILLTISTLNHGLLQPYCHVNDCIELTPESHICNGMTPLYSAVRELCGTLLRKIAEVTNSGRSIQTFTAIITDGAATDGGEPALEGLGGIVDEVRQTITSMTNTKQNIVCGIAIGGEANETFMRMGIPAQWMLDPARDAAKFDDAIRMVSRASRSASRGAGAFQHTANGAFR